MRYSNDVDFLIQIAEQIDMHIVYCGRGNCPSPSRESLCSGKSQAPGKLIPYRRFRFSESSSNNKENVCSENVRTDREETGGAAEQQSCKTSVLVSLPFATVKEGTAVTENPRPKRVSFIVLLDRMCIICFYFKIL